MWVVDKMDSRTSAPGFSVKVYLIVQRKVYNVGVVTFFVIVMYGFK